MRYTIIHNYILKELMILSCRLNIRFDTTETFCHEL
jgi:hypothetical protein